MLTEFIQTILDVVSEILHCLDKIRCIQTKSYIIQEGLETLSVTYTFRCNQVFLDEIKVDDLHVPAFFLQFCRDLCDLLWIVCRKGVPDPKTPANRDTGYPSQAIQFLAAGNQKSIPFFFSAIQKEFRTIQNNSEEIQT